MLNPRSFLHSRQSSASLSPRPLPALASCPHLAHHVEHMWQQCEVDDKENDTPEFPFKVQEIKSRPRTATPSTTAATLTPNLHLTPTPSPHPSPPASPMAIPTRTRNESAVPLKAAKASNTRRWFADQARLPQTQVSVRSLKWQAAHDPNAISPSVAALLAVTNIPPPKTPRRSRPRPTRGQSSPLSDDSTIEKEPHLEQDYALGFVSPGSPLDVLLSSPDELDSDIFSLDDSVAASIKSTRTLSAESMSSFNDSFLGGTLSSRESPTMSPRRKKYSPSRALLEPVNSPLADKSRDPLSQSDVDSEELDFRVFETPSRGRAGDDSSEASTKPFKSMFKSNLTLSLRALRQAARSFSLTLPLIPPEDFLSRSILTMDPRVPFTDERRPPVDEEPTAALRRYLNPTNTTRADQERTPSLVSATPKSPSGISIQMQTYKVQRSRSVPASSTGPGSLTRSRSEPQLVSLPTLPGPRQREMRENSDFIRIAVMEMAMRKCGKLDDQRPGRARWALPPRKAASGPYLVGKDGVPARWIGLSC